MQLPSPEIANLLHQINTWRNERVFEYGPFSSQLNLLFDDIEAGFFGENAKQGLWYAHVKSKKESIPKPTNLPALEAELEQLMLAVQAAPEEG